MIWDPLLVLIKGDLVIGFPLCCILCDIMHVSTHGRCPVRVGSLPVRIASILSEEVEEETVVNTPPRITLIGEAVVELEFGQTYAKCGATPRRDEKCDRGNAFWGFLGIWFFLAFLGEFGFLRF